MFVIFWIFQSFFSGLAMILAKKMAENKKVWNHMQTLFSKLNHIIVLGLFMWFWWFWFEFKVAPSDINMFNIGLFIVSVWLLYSTYPLRVTAYANEKVSVLQPFSMLSQVFPIIIWFIFIAQERLNILTFLMALLASSIVIFSNIDYQNFKINKYSMMILISSVIKSVQIFAIIYFLKFLSPEMLYFIECSLVIVVSSFFLIFKKQFWERKLISKDYFKLLVWWNMIALIGTILIFKMYAGKWIVFTSLMTLLYLAFVYMFGYILLKEIPKRKDVIVTLSVVVCIIVGLYFKS